MTEPIAALLPDRGLATEPADLPKPRRGQVILHTIWPHEDYVWDEHRAAITRTGTAVPAKRASEIIQRGAFDGKTVVQVGA